MCVLCGEPRLEVHWADVAPAAADPRGDWVRHRAARLRALAPVLATAGLRVSDWESRKYVLADRKGRSVVVHDLGEVWAAAERLLGRPLDPLDGAVLQALCS